MGEVNTGHYLQDGWSRRGQYRTDYTSRPLSTGWVVWERSIQDGLHKQAIIYRIGGVRELLPFREEDHASVWYHMWWQPDNLAQTLKYIFVMWTE